MTKKKEKKKSVRKKTTPNRKSVARQTSADKEGGVICFNRDCKLRKKKSCRGFEGCPGFQGK